MSRILPFSLLFSLLLGFNLNATEHTITTSGLTYTPAVLDAAVGDTVTFIIASNHPTAQVSEDSWNANQGTPMSGGFGTFDSQFSIEITEDMAPTIYYVCVNHIGAGMKGLINVMVSGVEEITNDIDFNFGPNPVSENQINYSIGSSDFDNGVLNIFNIHGQLIRAISINNSNGTISLDLVAGNYFMQIRNQDGELFASERITVLK